MPDMVSLVKRAAVEAMEAGKPVNVLFGTVISSSPLQINVEQKMKLGESQLILTRNVTDYKVMMTMDHETQSQEAHAHGYKGTKAFHVDNALKSGERVALLRLQGGQQFLVMDRLG